MWREEKSGRGKTEQSENKRRQDKVMKEGRRTQTDWMGLTHRYGNRE